MTEAEKRVELAAAEILNVWNYEDGTMCEVLHAVIVAVQRRRPDSEILGVVANVLVNYHNGESL